MGLSEGSSISVLGQVDLKIFAALQSPLLNSFIYCRACKEKGGKGTLNLSKCLKQNYAKALNTTVDCLIRRAYESCA